MSKEIKPQSVADLVQSPAKKKEINSLTKIWKEIFGKAQVAKDDRKSMRISVTENTIKLGFYALGALALGVFSFLIFTSLQCDTACFKMDLTNEINLLSLIITGVLNIIMLALGIIAGSSID